MIVVVGPDGVVVLVAGGALVEVDELDVVGDEEQPARMPAAPSAQSACATRFHLNGCVVLSLASRSDSG
jgi:hypothetical protein